MSYQPTPPPPRMKRFGFLAMGLAALGGLLVGGIGGSLNSSAPAPAPTVTVTATAPTPESTVEDSPTEEPAEPAVYKPHKADWALGMKVRKKQCFGSAGCNVTLKLDPQYVGDDPDSLPTEGTIEVFYKITGDEAGPVDGSFTVQDREISYTEEVDISTSSKGVKPKAKITDVTYSEN